MSRASCAASARPCAPFHHFKHFRGSEPDYRSRFSRAKASVASPPESTTVIATAGNHENPVNARMESGQDSDDNVPCLAFDPGEVYRKRSLGNGHKAWKALLQEKYSATVALPGHGGSRARCRSPTHRRPRVPQRALPHPIRPSVRVQFGRRGVLPQASPMPNNRASVPKCQHTNFADASRPCLFDSSASLRH